MTRPGEPGLDADLAADLEELLDVHAAVLQEAHRYRALFDAAPIALLVTDSSLKIVEANEAAGRLFGIEVRRLIDKPLAVFVEPSARPAFRRWQLHHRRAPGRAATELRLRRRNQVTFDAAVEVVAGRDEYYWSIADRTEAALAERQLWELNRELELRVAEQTAERDALLDELPVGVALVRPDGSVGWLNSRAVAAFGSNAQDLIVRSEPVRRALAGLVGERTTASVEADGETTQVEIAAAPVAGGGAVVVIEDFTERHRLERANDEFVQNAAHQLRTPITAIGSSVDALVAGAADDVAERERFLSHIARESARLAHLVDALLTLAGIERGGARFVELVPLRPLLQEVANQVDGRVVVRCGSKLAAVGDRDLIAEAVRNVMANAVRHGEGARVLVIARLTGEEVQIDVVDQGPGVPSEIGERIFERFYHGTARSHGSGLGLAIARAAAHGSRGTLELVPGNGPGARFRFTFPGARIR